MCSDWFGSSPRVRGKPTSTASLRPRGRLIPACAGKTSPPWPPPPSSWAHPRVCGENGLQLQNLPRAGGSSPRVRGKLYRLTTSSGTAGLIPACAGKTCSGTGSRPWSMAHPRVCGENGRRKRFRRRPRGSSPRVRGKRVRRHQIQPGLRLIPACAGKTRRRQGATRSSAAHPRVCGENLPDGTYRFRQLGSSPRVRGKLSEAQDLPKGSGLIPACAGKTSRPSSPTSRPWAHPRVCGENDSQPRWSRITSGSSPRVRGKRPPQAAEAVRHRLIPACAGKTRPGCRSCPSSAAHPRVCGENHQAQRALADQRGSSPRVRGKRCSSTGSGGILGLIPACAGKTLAPGLPGHMYGAHPRVCGENFSVRSLGS